MPDQKNNITTVQDITEMPQELSDQEKRIIEGIMQNIGIDDVVSIREFEGKWRVISIDGIENPIYTCAGKGKDGIVNIQTTGDKITIVKKHNLKEKMSDKKKDEELLDIDFLENNEEDEDNMSPEDQETAEEEFDEIETSGIGDAEDLDF